MWNGVTARFVVETLHDRRPVGSVVLYDVDERDGHGYFAIFGDEGPGSGITVIEGTGLLIDYAFRMWPLRKLYSEVHQANLHHFGSATHSLFDVEGHLRGHSYYDGRHWDLYILALHRDKWEIERRRWFEAAETT